MDSTVEGWEHVEAAFALYDDVITDLFSLPGAAAQRRDDERPTPEQPHGDDLLCGCWSAPEAASALLEMQGRHMESIYRLSELHAAFAMPAWTLGRAAFEQGIRLVWLLTPQAATEREQRWLVLEREEQRFFRNVGQIDESEYNELLRLLDAVAEREDGEPVPGVPSVERLVDELGLDPNPYELYRFLSQPIHGTMVGSGTFDYEARFGWNAEGGSGEWMEAEFWNIPLIATWQAASASMVTYRDLLATEHPLPSLDRYDEFISSLARVPPNYQARRTIASRKRSTQPLRPNRAQRRALARKRRRR